MFATRNVLLLGAMRSDWALRAKDSVANCGDLCDLVCRSAAFVLVNDRQ
jgi:hypothetical protein